MTASGLTTTMTTAIRWSLLALLAMAWGGNVHAQEEEKPEKKTEEASTSKSGQGEDDEGQSRRSRTYDSPEITVDGKKVSVTYSKLLAADGPDFAALADLDDGNVVQLTVSAPPKLMTEADLKFGDVVVEEGNVAANYPGVYGLWLRKTDSGWSLVFNERPDVWGTMHDPEHDVAEIPLNYEKSDDETDRLTIELSGENDVNTLSLRWGAHHWSAQFETAG